VAFQRILTTLCSHTILNDDYSLFKATMYKLILEVLKVLSFAIYNKTVFGDGQVFAESAEC
jgi:hypothetical protein